jgi:pyrroline-5-carboxylate reductase
MTSSETTLPLPGPFWLVGCGNMAGAMLARWLDMGIDRRLMTVIRPSAAPVAAGIRVLAGYPPDEVPSLVMLGMKPQKLDEVAPLLAPMLEPETILVSILAGVETASLRARFPAPRNIIRAMPNTPGRLGKGVTNIFAADADDQARTQVVGLMSGLGAVETFEREALFQAAGILTGAGPAFLYRFIDALSHAGAQIGLSREQGERLAKTMVEGAAALAASSAESPAQLADRVGSPGGTTRAGLAVLDEDEALNRLVARTLQSSLRRSDEMAAEASTRPS